MTINAYTGRPTEDTGDCPDCGGDGESSPGQECTTCGGAGSPTYCGDCGHLPADCTCNDEDEEA